MKIAIEIEMTVDELMLLNNDSIRSENAESEINICKVDSNKDAVRRKIDEALNSLMRSL